MTEHKTTINGYPTKTIPSHLNSRITLLIGPCEFSLDGDEVDDLVHILTAAKADAESK